MSFYAFCNPEKLQGVSLVSMAGLKSAVPNLLQSQGVRIFSCVDNDCEGRRFERENNFKRPENRLLENAGVKDWNELLVRKTTATDSLKITTPEIQNQNNSQRRTRR